METELSTAQADLDEATKELHAADERANRALAVWFKRITITIL